jgi:hypothetical protein
MTCSTCKTERASPTERIPRGWKRHDEKIWCDQCWKKSFVLRAITLPVTKPTRTIALVAAFAVLASGCMAGAQRPLVDIQASPAVDAGRSFEQDLADCNAYAQTIDVGQSAVNGAIAGAVLNAALGAALGGIIGHGYAGQGAALGGGRRHQWTRRRARRRCTPTDHEQLPAAEAERPPEDWRWHTGHHPRTDMIVIRLQGQTVKLITTGAVWKVKATKKGEKK